MAKLSLDHIDLHSAQTLRVCKKWNNYHLQYYQSSTIDFMFIFKSCMQSGQVLCGSFEETAVCTGVSDTIIVKHKDGAYRSTPFLVCFGPYSPTHNNEQVQVLVNGALIPGVNFSLDHKGYIHPHFLPDKQIKKLNLRFGMNKVTYKLEEFTIEAEIYLYTDSDRLVVSDVDGTVTKNDLGGHLHNFLSKDYLHAGYADLAQKIDKNGYKIVWLTMRALPLYDYSKNYLRQTCKIDGPILMEPEEFTNAVYNEVTKKTGNIKANMIGSIKKLFTINPFAGGLGNRQNDGVAYYHGGMQLQKIFIVDTKSRVQQMSKGTEHTSYEQMAANIENYFPYYSAYKVGYV